MKHLIGIDVGTSGVKCIMIDTSGNVIAATTETYPLYTPHIGWSEQNPEDWWTGTKNALKALIRSSGVKADTIASIGFSGQMHGLVLMDKADHVIRPAILWNDQRTQRECDDVIESAGGLEKLLDETNNTMLTGYTGGKLLWVKKNERQNFDRAVTFLMPKDYIRFRLTGEKATDVSDASGTGLFDVAKRQWNRHIIEKVGLPFEIFPEAVESDAIKGYITADAAAETGLPSGLPVSAGGGDAVIQTTGMGVVKEGTVGLIIGTSGVVSMPLSVFGRNTGGKLQYFCNNDKRLWQAFGCQLSSGGSMEWLKRRLYQGINNPYSAINSEAEGAQPGSGKLLFFPYLTGERCPYADPDARGVFFGLTSSHERGDIARSVMEGVTYGLRQIFELIRASHNDIQPQEIISSGGASKSAVWRQIQADIFGIQVKTLKGAAEGGAYGAALVAGVTAGIFKDLYECQALLTTDTITEPVSQHLNLYNDLFDVYNSMYRCFEPGYRRLAALK